MSASKKMFAVSWNVFKGSCRNASRNQIHCFRNSSSLTKLRNPSIIGQQTQLFVRYDSSVKSREKAESPGLSKELDSTDPDAIYSKVSYEQKSFNEDTKARDGIASSPDHYSSLNENEPTETLFERIKNKLSNTFSKK